MLLFSAIQDDHSLYKSTVSHYTLTSLYPGCIILSLLREYPPSRNSTTDRLTQGATLQTNEAHARCYQIVYQHHLLTSFLGTILREAYSLTSLYPGCTSFLGIILRVALFTHISISRLNYRLPLLVRSLTHTTHVKVSTKTWLNRI